MPRNAQSLMGKVLRSISATKELVVSVGNWCESHVFKSGMTTQEFLFFLWLFKFIYQLYILYLRHHKTMQHISLRWFVCRVCPSGTGCCCWVAKESDWRSFQNIWLVSLELDCMHFFTAETNGLACEQREVYQEQQILAGLDWKTNHRIAHAS